jgi:UDP-glucose:glycoprotein glucosyltransferase
VCDRLARKGEAVFNNLPTSLLLTMNMDTPHSWVVQAVRSVYDLDNILLKDMGKETRLSATFELQHILVEGTYSHTARHDTTNDTT